MRLWYFISPCTDPINPILAVVVWIYEIQIFDKTFFFLVAAVAMITERLPFFYFHDNHCQGNKFLLENNTSYQSKLSLKKRNQTDKESSREVVIKVHTLFLIVMTKTAAKISKHIKSYFSEFLNNICHIPVWILLIFKNSLFLKSPLCLVWIFCTHILTTF